MQPTASYPQQPYGAYPQQPMQMSQMPMQQAPYQPYPANQQVPMQQPMAYPQQQYPQQYPQQQPQMMPVAPTQQTQPQPIEPQQVPVQSTQDPSQGTTITINLQQPPNPNPGMVPMQMPPMQQPQPMPGYYPPQPMMQSTDVWQNANNISAHSIRNGIIEIELDNKTTFVSSKGIGPSENCFYTCSGPCKETVTFNAEDHPSNATNLDGIKITDMALCCSDNRDIIDLSDDSLLATITFKQCSEEAEVRKNGTLLYKVNDARAAGRSSRWCYEFPCIIICCMRQCQIAMNKGEKDCVNNKESLCIVNTEGKTIMETTPENYYFKFTTTDNKGHPSDNHVTSTIFSLGLAEYDIKQKKLFAGVLANLTSFTYNQFNCTINGGR